ncbi:FemAB family XrtA/PEP-CTERM system-associated protein [Marinobacter zhejiangensis]|uniref:FemAB-related protein, PEP-CTERM system-associated n=1 Tax=Marinobacter zhejiangensis TaxID=488535 RepID=A0A1I4RMF3_9GAMM|nr:FemAB family XrtA/PEP-CTERM system-associated protein [Marinobacter zhejiangensis]SFM53417.1 FemAB-related protein, PEP-CTERM system-associated [Marinobacter zhejiangensis]
MGTEVTTENPDVSKAKLDDLKAQKGRLGRLIGEAKKQGASAESLIAELGGVSDQIKSIQKQLKQKLNAEKPESKWVPGQASIPPAILDLECKDSIIIESSADARDGAIEQYLERHPGASIWHQPVVTSFISTTYSHETRYFFALGEGGRVVGVLPVVQLNSRLFGNFLVSLPYFNYGGVLADNPDIAGKLIEACNEWRDQQGAEHLELRACEDSGLGYQQRTDKVTFWLPLPEHPDDLWNSFKPKLRAQVRRGEKEVSGLHVGGCELLDDFYHVFSNNMRDLGTPVYGKDFFRNLLQSLDGHAWLVVAKIDGKPAGCAFITGFKGRMEIPWASTLRRYSHTGINMTMYWEILKLAIARGYGLFDFGRCSRDAGTYRFKQQWGAQPIDLFWDYVMPEGHELPALNPDNPKFKLLIAVWQRLPLFVANFLGPHIVKDLP